MWAIFGHVPAHNNTVLLYTFVLVTMQPWNISFNTELAIYGLALYVTRVGKRISLFWIWKAIAVGTVSATNTCLYYEILAQKMGSPNVEL